MDSFQGSYLGATSEEHTENDEGYLGELLCAPCEDSEFYGFEDPATHEGAAETRAMPIVQGPTAGLARARGITHALQRIVQALCSGSRARKLTQAGDTLRTAMDGGWWRAGKRRS